MFEMVNGAGIPATIWAAPNGSPKLLIGIAVALVLGFAAVFGLMYLPKGARRWLVTSVTFMGGFYFIMHWLWPKPYHYERDQIPRGLVEGVGAWLSNSLPTITAMDQSLAACLLGIGIYSLLRLHLGRLFKLHADWFFSLVLVASLLLMVLVGYWDWVSRLGEAGKLVEANPRIFPNYMNDFLFDGMFVNMDACMFSIISFFIFSAAYRAFRIRSLESTILLVTALIIMLSLMGAVSVGWDGIVNSIGKFAPDWLTDNIRLAAIKGWVQDTLQVPSIRAMEFGLAIGALAMSLRLWLSLEKGVSH
jgi:hypothetical protein